MRQIKKRILFCSDIPLSRALGGSKVLVELAEEMEQLGWSRRLAGPEEICPGLESCSGLQRMYVFSESLKRYLQRHAAEYDVVDYGHQYLPYPRMEFNPRTLLVARSVLLMHHLETIPIPRANGSRAMIGNMIKGPSRRNLIRRAIERATLTVQEADVVNVSNNDDKRELVKRGIPEERIAVLPFGMSRSARPLFDAVFSEPPPQPVVAFVGTFDYRKGAAELPKIVRHIVQAVPQVRFKLMGARGLFQTKDAILSHFPPALAARIEVVLDFGPEELPKLLESCSVGIFPSHVEGFGFGVLEMLAASVPVVAYNAPGPPMMLPPEYLVPRGDVRGMSAKVIALLTGEDELGAARRWAKQRSHQFCWSQIAQQTSEAYSRYLEEII